MKQGINIILLMLTMMLGLFVRKASAENYSYIGVNDVSGDTTRTPISSSAEERQLLSEYPDMSSYTGKYVIPGLKYTLSKNSTTGQYCVATERYVPQGICVAGQYLLITAYDSEGIYNSVVYVMKASDNTYITTLILPTASHCGGITYDTVNSYIWVCDGYSLSGFSYSFLNTAATNVLNRKNTSSAVKAVNLVSFAKKLGLRNNTNSTFNASFCTFFDNRIWVGEFSANSTKEAYALTINASSNSIRTDYIMEVPRKSQGMVFYRNGTDVYLFVSTSYGRDNDSNIYLYNTSYSNPETISGKTYKRIYKNNHIDRFTFLPMAEGITVSGNMLYIIFESGAYTYHEPEYSWQDDPKPFGEYLRYDARHFIV